MDATFETIGLEVPSEKAINFLAERAENQGEPTQILRRGAVLHGRCWKLGEGWKSGQCSTNRKPATSFMRIAARVFALATRSASALGIDRI